MKSPASRVVCLSAAMAMAGTALSVYSLRWGLLPAPLHIPWWAFAPAYFLSYALVLHFEVREEAHSITFSELPLVLGLFFTSPIGLIGGRLLGEALYFGVRRRQAPLKLVFNLSMFLLETSVAVVVFRTLYYAASPMDATGWLAVLVALAVADVVSLVMVSCAVRWHGGHSSLASIGSVAGVAAVVNCSLAILASIVLWVRPAGLVFFAIVGSVSVLAYRGYATLKQRYAGLQLLYDFTKVVGASMKAEAVMDEVLAEARKLLRAGVAEVVLLDGDRQRMTLRQRNCDASVGQEQLGEAELRDLAIDGAPSVWAQVVEHGSALILARWSRSSGEAALRDQLGGVRDAIVTPLHSDDKVVGTLMVANRLGDVTTFDDQDRRLFETLANHASVAFENGRLVDQLRQEADERRHEALHDSLTGLPNRSLFIQRLEAAAASDAGQAAIMLMDLDRFKEINDTLGHHNGDTLLRKVAVRLTGVLRPTDTIARLGGDEFAFLLPNISNVNGATRTAHRIIEALAHPFAIEEMSLEVGASIGIALSPEHGDDAATLLQRADVAMYEAKGSADGVAVYTSEKDSYSPRRLALAGELRRALDDGDILVYHQPKARLSDGRAVGTEALVRWQHPTYGFLPPDEFIPGAEHTGVISVLTVHVLRSALRQCAEWRGMGHDIGVAVNLAVRCLLDNDLPNVVRDILAETGVPANKLTLEVTESSIMAEPVRTISVLERLAGVGVKLSVDDFGTGYSSLAYLQKLPVQEVKVDKSFVLTMATDPNDAMIVQSIVELGHNLDLQVVAEGVEDEATWDRLRTMSCDIAQGYLLSRPAPAADLTRWLAERAASFGPAAAEPPGPGVAASPGRPRLLMGGLSSA